MLEDRLLKVDRVLKSTIKPRLRERIVKGGPCRVKGVASVIAPCREQRTFLDGRH